MRRKSKEERRNQIWIAVQRFLTFFLLMGFVITCSMVLFLETMKMAVGVEFQQEEIQLAARLTFVNVVFLSLLCAVIDEIRRRIMVGRPVKKIIAASEKIIQGDLSAFMADRSDCVSFLRFRFCDALEWRGQFCAGVYFLCAFRLCNDHYGNGGCKHCKSVSERGESFTHPKKIYSIPIGERYLRDVRFRSEVSLYQGLFIHLLYVALKLFSGIRYQSVWFIALAIYYIFLSVMRFLLLHHVRKLTIGQDIPSEQRRYRACGFILLLMNEALVGIIIYIVHLNQGFTYPGLLIYTMSTYAFYSIITAIINVVKFRKYGSPVLSAAKNINLTAALVSMLSLETAMLAQFGGNDSTFRQIMTASSGAVISVIVLGMAIFMIVRANRQLKIWNINSL